MELNLNNCASMDVHMAQNYHYQTTCITGKKERKSDMPSRTTSLFEKYHGFNKFANRNFQSGLVENVNFPIPEVNYVGYSDGPILNQFTRCAACDATPKPQHR